jgi:CHAP domain-containing protein
MRKQRNEDRIGRHGKCLVFITSAVLLAVAPPAARGAPLPFGTQVGSFNGVPIYSNGSGTGTSTGYNSVPTPSGPYTTGLKWQCVEFAVRYYYQVYGKRIRIAGDAWAYFGNAQAEGLTAISNGATSPPRPGDILCFGGGWQGNGHLAIVTQVGSGYVLAAQQNVRNNAGDASFRYPMSLLGGRYYIDASVLNVSYTYGSQGGLRVSASYGQKAIITSPPNGATLPGSTASFSWSGAIGYSQFSLQVGNSPGASDLWSGSLGTSSSVTFNGLPTDGRTLYFRLGTLLSNGWQYSDSSYRAANTSTIAKAIMINPPNGSRLSGSTATFQWTAVNGASQYYIYLGNSQGAADLWAGSVGLNTGITFNGLPHDGRVVWIRLWTQTSSGWLSSDSYYYTARY